MINVISRVICCFYCFINNIPQPPSKGLIIWRFQPGLKFQLVKRVEMSSRLNSKLLFKMTLQLHVKISTRYSELKFQLGLAKPR